MQIDKLISAAQCADLFSVHRTTWWYWVRHDPDAPRPALRGSNLTRWRQSDVALYMERRIARSAAGAQ